MRCDPAAPRGGAKPRWKGLVPRTRLFCALDAAMRAPIVWLGGPPGSGKTSLVRTYLADSPSVLWLDLSLPALQSNSLRQAIASFLRASPPVGAKTPTVRVVDGAHLLTPRESWAPLLRWYLQQAGEEEQLLVLGRLPPPEMADLRLEGRLMALGARDLALDSRETAQWLEALGAENAPLRAGEVHALTSGWAMGVASLAKERREAGEKETLTGELLSFLERELLGGWSEEEKTALARLGILERLDAQGARRLGGGQGVELLARLAREEGFVHRLPSEPEQFAVHPSLRCLLEKIRGRLEPETLEALRREAVEILCGDGRREEAGALLMQEGSSREWAEFVELWAEPLLAEGQAWTLERWIASMGEENWGAHPRWIVRMAECEGEGLRLAAPKLDDAFRAFWEKGDFAWALRAFSCRIEAFFRLRGDPKGLDTFLGWMEVEGEGRLEEVDPAIAGRAVARMLAACVRLWPEGPMSARWAARAKSAASRPSPVRRELGRALFHYHFWRGETGEAAVALSFLREAQGAHRDGPAQRREAAWAQAIHRLWAEGDGQGASALLDEALADVRQSGNLADEALLVGTRAWACVLSEDLAGARRELDRMRGLAPSGAADVLGALHHITALVEHLCGSPHNAAAHASEALRLFEAGGMRQEACLCRIALGRIAARQGRPEQSPSFLENARAESRRLESRGMLFSAQLASAEAALANGAEEEARTWLARAFALGREEGYRTELWWWDRPALERLCRVAVERDVEREYAAGLIRQWGFLPDPSSPTPEAWPWEVRLYALGRFEVVVHGKPVRSTGKAQQKPLELLRGLLAHGGRNVAADRLADELWPDSDGARAHHALETTLYRLRALLGGKDVVTVEDGRVTLDPRFVWVDVWAFQRGASRASALFAKNPEDPEAMRHAENALGLYRGGFLQGHAEEPAREPLSRLLRDAYVRLALSLGAALERKERASEALALYERGTRTEPSSERLHRRLIEGFLRQGYPSEAALALAHCRKCLRRFTGTDPSPETEALLPPPARVERVVALRPLDGKRRS